MTQAALLVFCMSACENTLDFFISDQLINTLRLFTRQNKSKSSKMCHLGCLCVPDLDRVDRDFYELWGAHPSTTAARFGWLAQQIFLQKLKAW